MNARQALKVLELSQDATRDEIKKAYRKMALESHPDKGKTRDDQKFKRVTEAYNVLKSHEPGQASPEATRPQSQWGAPRDEKTPEEDWGRFTREFEQENPDFWKEYERKFWEEYDTAMRDGKKEEFEKTKEPSEQPNLSIKVDPTLCIGCCSCEIIAPEVFEVDKESHTNPKSRVINSRGAKYNNIVNAAETCPTKAIIVDNIDARERIYPL